MSLLGSFQILLFLEIVKILLAIHILLQDASVPPDCTIEEVDTCNDPNVIQSVVQPGSPVTDTTNETSREKMSCFLKSDGDRSEQPTISIKKPSNARVSPMKRKQRLELPKEGISTRSPSLSKFKQKTNECETPTEDIPSGFRNPTSKGTGPNVSTSVNADELPDQPSQGKRTVSVIYYVCVCVYCCK